MLIPPMFELRGRRVYNRQEYDNCTDQMDISERLRKTLYYGKAPKSDRPSLPLTELSVEFCQDAARRELGRVDCFVASSMGRRACMSPCSMMLGMLYIERLKKKNPGYLRKVSSSDLFLISMMMASKYVYDEGVDEEVFNDEWAESARMDVEDVNELEMDFLSAIDWSLFVHPEDFHQVMNTVERRIALQQALARNWFSCTDLWVLLQDPKYGHYCMKMSKDVGKVVIVFSLAYMASILTLVGSVATLTYISANIACVGPAILPPRIAVIEQPSYHGDLQTNENATEDFTDAKTNLSKRLTSPISPQTEHESPSFLKTVDGVKQTDYVNLNYVLPQLWAVVTLKDAFVRFVSAVSGNQPSSQKTSAAHTSHKGQLPPLSPLSCQLGPCSSTMTNTGLSCRNVSNYGLPNVRYRSLGKYTGSQNCCTHCQRRMLGTSRQQQQHGPSSTPLNAEIRCCCRLRSAAVDPWQLQMDPFPDIILGFHTGTLNPLTART